MNEQYQRGRRLEYRVRDYFRNLGYMAERTAGSHSPVDIFVIDASGVIFVQVTRDDSIARSKWDALWNAACHRKARPLVAVVDAGGHLEFYEMTGRRGRTRARPWKRFLVPGALPIPTHLTIPEMDDEDD